MALTQKKTKETLNEAGKKSKEIISVPKTVKTTKDGTLVKDSVTEKNKKTITRKEAQKKNAKKIKQTSKQGFFKGVREELGKVTWPTKKDMVKYSIATILFILFFALFFYIIDLLMALLKAVA